MTAVRAATTRHPAHVLALMDNVREVMSLTAIQGDLAASKRGGRYGPEILSRSALVLLVACWEAFVEDLATAAFRWLLKNADTPDAFPARVLTLASRPLRQDPDETKVWALAHNGWRRILQEHGASALQRHVGSLNTPKPRQVSELFRDLLGFPELSRHWEWGRTTGNANAMRLEKLVERRGEIAHRVAASTSVRRSEISDAAEFIIKLAVISSNRIGAHLHERTRIPAWPQMAYQNAS